MKKHNLWLIPLLTLLTISLSLWLTIYVKIAQETDLIYSLRYLLVGVIGFIFSWILMRFNQALAAKVFLGLSLLSGLILYIMMPPVVDGFGQLGALVMWMFAMGGSIIITIIIVLYNKFIKK